MFGAESKKTRLSGTACSLYHCVLIPASFIVVYPVKISTLSYFAVACTLSEFSFLLIIISHTRLFSVTA